MVIQRWQTIFLLIASVMMGVFTFGSLGQFQLADYSLNFHTWGISSEGIPTDGSQPFCMGTIYLAIISGFSCLLPLISIFLYRNLKLQKQVCAISALFVIATGFTAATLGYSAIDNATVSWSSIAFAPFIAITACVIAYRGIASDKRKIENADRIR